MVSQTPADHSSKERSKIIRLYLPDNLMIRSFLPLKFSVRHLNCEMTLEFLDIIKGERLYTIQSKENLESQGFLIRYIKKEINTQDQKDSFFHFGSNKPFLPLNPNG